MAENEKWYDLKKASKEAGVSTQTIYSAIRAGKLVARQISDSSRFGFHYMIGESALLEWVEDRKTVKANAVATSKDLSAYNIQDLAAEITLRIQNAYEKGIKEGKKAARREIKEQLKQVLGGKAAKLAGDEEAENEIIQSE